MLARLQCTFSPRINRPSGGGAVSSRQGQLDGIASSAVSPQLFSNIAEGRLELQQMSERSQIISPVHDRLYRAAMLSQERLEAAMRSGEQVCCPNPAAH